MNHMLLYMHIYFLILYIFRISYSVYARGLYTVNLRGLYTVNLRGLYTVKFRGLQFYQGNKIQNPFLPNPFAF